MAYIKTEDISVFPSTRRMVVQPSARLVSEQSFANQISKLIETDGFVITPEDGSDAGYSSDEPFEFNIHGYYFWVESAVKITSQFSNGQENSIYGNIRLDKEGNYAELQGQDVSSPIGSTTSFYQGLELSSTDLTKATGSDKADYSLKLFEKIVDGESTYWAVPIESRLKFVYTIALGVDGKEIV